ncbi:MFS transporter [Motiliproteus sediminis]|uniref:MFS transporter n=1 Tax=Motiliproteus sediminis TaxID=1468178 RepID=UPI001AEFF4CA|nr:MFS transporter [Motiliproteus sediminis]
MRFPFRTLFEFANNDDEARLCRDIPERQCHEQPRNLISQVSAQAFSKTGDALADTKVVLPWLLAAVGAPAFMSTLLVPIREALSLLPQILFGALIRRYPVRKVFWVGSSVVEGGCVMLMAMVALANLSGALAGTLILMLLVVFSAARGVASIAAKDTLGKTITKGRRGRVNGYSATIAGISVATVGLGLTLAQHGGDSANWLPWLLFGAGCCWLIAAGCFNLTREYPGATDGGRQLGDLMRDQWHLLLHDPQLQLFLLARALLLATALVGPLYVLLAQQQLGSALDSLGWLIVASGLAGACSSLVWGALADYSSKLTMALAALLSALLGAGVAACYWWLPTVTGHVAFYALVLFVLGVAHAGFRIGRKTHIIDMAAGDLKAEYVALSNTLIGILLLLAGGLTAALVGLGLVTAIATLSLITLLGALASLALRNAQQ